MSIAPLWDGLSERPIIKFSDMHQHTEYSLKDGMTRIQDPKDPKHNKGEIILNAERRGTGFVTATDHGNMYGQAILASEAQKYGLKHAPACEFYVAPGDMTDKSLPKGSTIYYHMCAWAKNKEGYKHLCQLQKVSYCTGFYNKPRIDRNCINLYGDDIVWSDACMAGPISLEINKGNEKLAREWFDWLTNRFGDDFYIEYQNHGIKEEAEACDIKIDWANKSGVPVIATIDSHFYRKEDEMAHKVLLCTQWKKWYDDPSFQGFAGDGYWLMDEDELLARFPVEYINNTQLIVDKVEDNIIEFGKVSPPSFQVPQDFMDAIGGAV